MRAGPAATMLAFVLLGIVPVAVAQDAVVFGPEEKGYPSGFTPARIEAQAGQDVTFRNDGKFAHTVTFPGYDSGNVDPGKSVTFRAPTTPGEHRFVCTYHEETGMVGTLVVAPAAQSIAPVTPSSAPAQPTSPTPATPARDTPAPSILLALVLVALAACLRRGR